MFLRLFPLLASLLVVALAEPGGSRTPELLASCLAGVPGIPGHHGAPGRDGRDGEKGVAGSKGEPGFPGSKGAVGDKGAPGKFGPSGGVGPIGPPGPRGSKGDEGGSPVVPKSAFTAKISSSNPPAGSPIKFDVVVSNDQSHYDPLSGKFTCVHPGLYYFVMHAHVYKHDLGVALIKNGNRVVSFCSNNIENKYANAISGGSVLSLKAGDHVWLQVVDAYNGMFAQPGYRDSSFTGFLLFPD